MKVLITGAGGFIGQRVVRELIEQGTIHVDGQSRTISAIYAADMVGDVVDALAAEFDMVKPLVGDLTAPEVMEAIRAIDADVIIHLAAVVSSAAEADFDLGMKVNVDALRALIDCCRAQDTPPVFVFTSSVAVFSCQGNAAIDEDCLPMPLSSYGAQKVMGEYLLRDASRKGFLKGRTIRFPTISVRPGKPNSAASSFASGIIREPLAGEEALLPVPRSTRLHLASPDMAVRSVLHAVALTQEAIGNRTTITLPGVSVSVEEMLNRLRYLAGDAVADRVQDAPDPKIEAIVGTWPGSIAAPKAEALGFERDENFDALITAHIKTSA